MQWTANDKNTPNRRYCCYDDRITRGTTKAWALEGYNRMLVKMEKGEGVSFVYDLTVESTVEEDTEQRTEGWSGKWYDDGGSNSWHRRQNVSKPNLVFLLLIFIWINKDKQKHLPRILLIILISKNNWYMKRLFLTVKITRFPISKWSFHTNALAENGVVIRTWIEDFNDIGVWGVSTSFNFAKLRNFWTPCSFYRDSLMPTAQWWTNQTTKPQPHNRAYLPEQISCEYISLENYEIWLNFSVHPASPRKRAIVAIMPTMDAHYQTHQHARHVFQQ